MANHEIAVAAKKPSDLSCGMIVIDVEVDTWTSRVFSSTDSAFTTLGLEELVVIIDRNPVGTL